jgi:hypothetical protein
MWRPWLAAALLSALVVAAACGSNVTHVGGSGGGATSAGSGTASSGSGAATTASAGTGGEVDVAQGCCSDEHPCEGDYMFGICTPDGKCLNLPPGACVVDADCAPGDRCAGVLETCTCPRRPPEECQSAPRLCLPPSCDASCEACLTCAQSQGAVVEMCHLSPECSECLVDPSGPNCDNDLIEMICATSCPCSYLCAGLSGGGGAGGN